MKKQYRVNVPAVIAFDVVAESEEQAKRIAAAATYTPVEPMFIDGFDRSRRIGLSIWAATYDQDGTIEGIDGELTGKGVEIIDKNEIKGEEALLIDKVVREFAAFNGNEEELAAALKS